MPTPITLPYPPLLLIQSDEPITWRIVSELAGDRLRTGISLCIQAKHGHKNRGGYFFHFKKIDNGVVFRTFDRGEVITLPNEDEATAFINHVSGRKYSEVMWDKAELVNMRTDTG